MFIGDQIRAARERRGMTQKQLAEAVGVSEGTAVLWENKRNPRQINGQNLSKVAEVLGTTVGELLGDEPPQLEDAAGRMLPLLVTLQEKAIVMLFRSFPEKLQLLQLAQFVECANLSQAEYFQRQPEAAAGADPVTGDSQAA